MSRYIGKLPEESVDYILKSYQSQSMEEIAINLGLKSKYKVQEVLVKRGLSRVVHGLTDEQKAYITANYKEMSNATLRIKLELKSCRFIQRFKFEMGYMSDKEKGLDAPCFSFIMKSNNSGLFNIHERENWLT